MKRISILIPCFLLFAQAALPWGNEGHMLVAAIAYQKLTPAVRARVAALLQRNPNYQSWIAGASPQQRDQIAFIAAATWPDAIKRTPGYVNDGEHPRQPAAAARNIGYIDKLQHRYWHFIDIPFSPDGTELVQPVPPNAQSQIALFRATLESSASDDVKSYDLVWLIHLVGDVHQPLHATSRFDREQPEGDEGGNLVALCAAPCKNELHGYWDDVPGTSSDPRVALTKAAQMRPAAVQAAQIGDEKAWIQESFQAAKQFVYVPPIGVGPGPFALTPVYQGKAQSLAEDRIALAGVRLADLINQHLR
jgi:hypothetical protein